MLALILLPLLAVLGAQLVNIYQSNVLLMSLIALLAIIPILMLTRLIPEKYYGLAVWVTALSLLLHRSLISQYLWGADVIGEYAAFRTVIMNSLWSPDSPNLITAYNVTLSVTILPVMLCRIMSIEGLWIFKLIFPILFSLAPLAVYEVLKNQFSVKVAFLSSFLLMSLYTFYTTFLGVGKQLIATLLLSLFALLMLDNESSPRTRTFLLTIFGVGVIVSHYSSAFLLAIIVAVSATGLYILRRRSASLTIIMVVVLVAVSFLWYGLQADGAVIKQFLGMGGSAVTLQSSANATTDTTANEAQRLLSQGSTNMPDSMRYLYIVTQVFMVLGFAVTGWQWLRRKEQKIRGEFMAFALLFLCLLALEIILPKFANVISLDRIYFVCVIFLAPFMIIGVECLISTLRAIVSNGLRKEKLRGVFKSITSAEATLLTLEITAVFLAIFLIVNTGFIYELAGEPLATSIALSRDNANFPVFSEAEFTGAKWLQTHSQNPDTIYYDSLPYHLFAYLDSTDDEISGKTTGHIIYRQPSSDSVITTNVPSGSSIYLRDYNLKTGKLALGWPSYQTMDIRQLDTDKLGAFSLVIDSSNIVYTNGSSEVLYTLHNYNTPKD
ncbi:MAG: DUF2206 domain-containing protein [Dehalococcoidales bacterium]|nr:DUF2206 domain-containing protein [Dehalococcoidales bacterium]